MRIDLKRAAALNNPARRFAALAEWVQGLYDVDQPVLVGGGAVALHTNGAYVTEDLDFVGTVPRSVESKLLDAGFRRVGRHWVHEEYEIFVEFPADRLDPDARTTIVATGGCQVQVLGLEETLVDRLCSWQFWDSEIDAINTFLLWQAKEEQIDRVRLRELAVRSEVEESWHALERFVERLAGRPPDRKALEAWARRQT